MLGVCGAKCEECSLYNNKCKGCPECLQTRKCWIADYINIGGKEKFKEFKNELINEIKSLNIDEINTIDTLYPLKGMFVNLEYNIPNDKKVKLLNDNDVYLGNQIDLGIRYIGIVCNMNFILISEYDKDYKNTEIIIYKKR